VRLALIGRFLVRMSKLYEFYGSHPVTDPLRRLGMTPFYLLLPLWANAAPDCFDRNKKP
jgi:hypothetical protein